MKSQVWILLGVVVLLSCSKEITLDNWDYETLGKTGVFIMFGNPGCGHCQAVKPTWDKLIHHYSAIETTGIYIVDCGGDGRLLCQQAGVEDYPAFRYGNPVLQVGRLHPYQGSKELRELKKFGKQQFPLVCAPGRRDKCTPEQKTVLGRYLSAPAAALTEELKSTEAVLKEKWKRFSREKSDIDDARKTLKQEIKEFNGEQDMYMKAKKKFDKKAAKASNAQKARQAEKDRAMLERAQVLKKRQTSMEEEKISWQHRQSDLETEYDTSGIMLMRLVMAHRRKDRSEL